MAGHHGGGGKVISHTRSQLVNTVATHLRESADWLLLVGVLTSIITGSRLFITLESCFGIIFRLRARHPILQIGHIASDIECPLDLRLERQHVRL